LCEGKGYLRHVGAQTALFRVKEPSDGSR
jgi:hypothetical protein